MVFCSVHNVFECFNHQPDPYHQHQMEDDVGPPCVTNTWWHLLSLSLRSSPAKTQHCLRPYKLQELISAQICAEPTTEGAPSNTVYKAFLRLGTIWSQRTNSDLRTHRLPREVPCTCVCVARRCDSTRLTEGGQPDCAVKLNPSFPQETARATRGRESRSWPSWERMFLRSPRHDMGENKDLHCKKPFLRK